MKVMPLVFVTDTARSVAFYEGLGLTVKTEDRSGMWFELMLGDAGWHCTRRITCRRKKGSAGSRMVLKAMAS